MTQPQSFSQRFAHHSKRFNARRKVLSRRTEVYFRSPEKVLPLYLWAFAGLLFNLVFFLSLLSLHAASAKYLPTGYVFVGYLALLVYLVLVLVGFYSTVPAVHRQVNKLREYARAVKVSDPDFKNHSPAVKKVLLLARLRTSNRWFIFAAGLFGLSVMVLLALTPVLSFLGFFPTWFALFLVTVWYFVSYYAFVQRSRYRQFKFEQVLAEEFPEEVLEVEADFEDDDVTEEEELLDQAEENQAEPAEAKPVEQEPAEEKPAESAQEATAEPAAQPAASQLEASAQPKA